MIAITWKAEKRKVAMLKHFEKNPRKITPAAMAKLKDRIQKRGFHDVVKVDTNDVVLSGNMRLDVLSELGIDEVNVLVPDRKLASRERDAVVLESNRTDGEWDWSILVDMSPQILMEAGFLEEELRVNIGLMGAEEEDVDLERMGILTVLPPESPKLKERAGIHCDTIEQYKMLKAAVESGAITAVLLEGIAKKTK